MKTHNVFWGDARNMGDLADNSVHLSVTSPPYWQLKDYGTSGQIGFDQSLDEYLTSLHEVWAECFRVLHSGCRLCVNIGDQFARAAHYGRYKVIPLHEAVIHSCEQIGFDYMGAIIWQKNTTMNTSGGGSVMGSFPYPRNGVVKIDYEFILLFKKLGKPPKVTPEQKQNAAMTTKEWNEYFNGHWNFAGERQGDGHIAMFPLELPRRLIRMFSFPGETVLDPFLGSGTTMSAAIELARNAIGYEINQEFEGAIRQRLNLHTEQLNFHEVQFLESRAPKKINIASTNGASSLTRQVNPKDFRFNSVIGLEDAAKPRERGLRVHEIIAPDQLRLADGGLVHLLGIRPRDGKEAEAMNYLKTKLLNRPIFLKHAEPHKGALRAYVYMENKTFINAKLIKEGLAEVDPDVEHHYTAQFNKYSTQHTHAI
jgi:site-specific DNA-methyltransferase (adenine-specific)